MSTRIDGRDGWIEVTRDGLHLLAKGDASLAAVSYTHLTLPTICSV